METAEHPTLQARRRDGAQAAPRVLDRYRLVRRLGSGGFGVVWLAHDERLDRVVAVKRVAVEDPAMAQRAEREAIAAARLSHPGIVALFEAGRDGDAVYLVSELVRGCTLADLIEGGELSDRDVLRVGVAMCDALEHAHSRGVIHRDVKPGNVMVPESPRDGGGVAKLTDFGIARVLGDDALTQTGDVVGTLAYMAPEQAEGRPASEATDLYALALVLFEALCGVNPVRGNGAASTARRVGSRLPRLSRMRRDLPSTLCAAIDTALLPRPSERGTLADLRAALAETMPLADDEQGTIAGSPLEGLRDAGRSAQVRPARVPMRLAAAACAAALAAAALVWLGPTTPIAPVAGAGIAALTVGLLPRVGWLAVATALTLWLATPPASAPGLAVIVAAAAALTPVLLRWARTPAAWSAPVLAPLLGFAGLAGAWPAVAGQARSFSDRAALGALGFWWLALAEPLVGRVLLLGPAPDTGARAQWQGSAADATQHVLVPLVSGGALAIAVLWALAAALLPMFVRGRSPAVDFVAATAWAAGLAAATQAIAQALDWSAAPATVHGLVAGAAAAAAIAVLARASRGAA